MFIRDALAASWGWRGAAIRRMRWPDGMFLFFPEVTRDAELVINLEGVRYVTSVEIWLVNAGARVKVNPYLIPGWDDQQWWPEPPNFNIPAGVSLFVKIDEPDEFVMANPRPHFVATVAP